MKGQRRHELKQNDLADWLAGVFQTVKPYQNAILGVVVLAVVGTAAYAWWSRQSSARAAAGWDDFYTAISSGNPAKFDRLIEQYPDTPVAQHAAVVAGDLHLAYGCNMLFVNKASANQELRKAVEHYLTVLGQSPKPMLREQATFGLARALEAQGDLEGAAQRYEEVGRNWPDGAYAAAAARRLDDLNRASTKAIYDKFAKFDPKPAFTDEPGTPGRRLPFDLDSLPDEGPVFQPDTTFNLNLEERGPEDQTTPGDADETPPETDTTEPAAPESQTEKDQ